MLDFESLFVALNNLTFIAETVKDNIIDAFYKKSDLEFSGCVSDILLDVIERNLRAANEILSNDIFSILHEAKTNQGEAERLLRPRRFSPHGQKPMSRRCRVKLAEVHSKIFLRVRMLTHLLSDLDFYYDIANTQLMTF